MRIYWLIMCCAGCVGTATSASYEERPFDPAAALSSASGTGKADAPVSCGDATCDSSLCGYDCEPGSLCVAKCQEHDQRQDAYVAVTVSGATSAAFDSRTIPYDPKRSLSQVLFYGCNLWRFNGGGAVSSNSLDVEYEEIHHANLTTDDRTPESFGIDFNLGMGDDLAGPGDYRAAVHYQASYQSDVASNPPRYVANYATNPCQLHLAADGAGGFKGTLACDDVAAEDGSGTISIRGEFACPPTAMAPVIVALPAR